VESFSVGQATGQSKISGPQAGGGTDNASDVVMLSDLDFVVDNECDKYDSNMTIIVALAD
jgi:hypothetical protein